MFISDNSAEGFYALDRASDAIAYCGFLEELEAAIRKLHSAISRGKQKKTRAITSRIKQGLQTWPEYPYLDVTEEHGEKLAQQLSSSLRVVKKRFGAKVSLAAISSMLSILQREYDAADHFTAPDDD